MSKDSTRKTIFISELAEGRQLHDLFLVSRKNLAETKNGKPYLALTLMDRTGEIEARIWENAAHFDKIAEPGRIVAAEAQVKAFRDQLQLSITSLAPLADDECELSLFIPASKRSVKEMKQELAGLIETISDPHLHQLLASLFQGEVLQQFSKAPAAKQMHHAYLGGLLEHTLSVAGLAVRIAEHYPALDRDLLVAGALAHDLGKIREFSFAAVPFDYTTPGRLVGHLVLGSEMVRQQAGEIPDFPADRLDQLIHLILSHHGRHEFGAPCLPMTAEAILLHHLDDIDAKINFIDRLSEQVEPGNYQWSDYQRPLERFLLLRGPESAPADQAPPHGPRRNGTETDPEGDAADDSEGQAGRQRKLF
ncbi:MAG: HD domain-containing protein [Desulfobulbaceae bacterium]|nr:HD domain-containing protein [Desulfobulbaceae bacterium]